MSEVAANPNLLKPESITDPGLVQIATELEACIAPFDDVLADFNHIVGAAKQYQDNQEVITLPAGETTSDPEITGASRVISDAATTFREYIPTMDSEANAVRKKFGRILSANARESALTEVLFERMFQEIGQATVPQGNGKEPYLIRQIFQAVDFAVDVAKSKADDPTPSLTPADARRTLQPLHELKAMFDRAAAGEPFEADANLGDVLAALPSKATVQHLSLLAFTDTLRGLLNVDPRKVSAELTKAQNTLLAEGTRPDDIVAHLAARVLDLAPTSDDTMTKDVLRIQDIAAFVGLSRIERIRLSSGRTPNLAKLPTGPKLVFNAMEVMKEILSAHEAMGLAHESLAVNPSLIDMFLKETGKLVVSEITDIPQEAFYEQLGLRLSKSDASEDIVVQALELEERMLTELESRVTAFEKLGLVSIQDIVDARAKLVPRLKNYIEATDNAQKLAELDEFIQGITSQIDAIEKPYTYTAKKIRSFEGGTELLRTMEEELDRHDLLRGEELRQALAIMILQAENAEDRTAYHDGLKQDRYDIEKLLADLKFLDYDHRTNLTDVLQWVDEIIDAGLDKQIRHERLQKFIYEYFVGPEDEAEPEVAPVTDLTDPEPTPDEPSGDEPPAPPEDAPTPPAGRDLVEQYFASLSEILETIDIEYADVDVFPPGATDVVRRAGSKEIDRFIDVDPKRLQGLARLKKEFETQGKSARLMITNPTKWSPLPHFALYIQEHAEASTGVCLLENPVNGNASYTFAVDGTLIQKWEELAAVSRQSARDDYGAKAFEHPPKVASNFAQHYDVKLKSHLMIELAKLRAVGANVVSVQ